jgi:DNA-binding response OmpR family regulator
MERVLVVAGQDTVRRELADLIARIGGKAYEAGNIKAAIHELMEKKDGQDSVTLAIAELELNGESGRDFLVQLRSSLCASVPAILVAAKIEKAVVEDLIKCGVDGILCRPFSADALKAEIEKARKRREAVELKELMQWSGMRG